MNEDRTYWIWGAAFALYVDYMHGKYVGRCMIMIYAGQPKIANSVIKELMKDAVFELFPELPAELRRKM